MMYNPLLLPELKEMLRTGDRQSLTELLDELHAATLAEFSAGLSSQEIWQLLDYAPIERQAEVFSYVPLPKQVELVQEGEPERVARLLEAMPHDARVDLLKQLDEQLVEQLLPLVRPSDRRDIRHLLSYPEHSAGAVMTTDFAWTPAHVTVQEALERLRQQAAECETIYYVYVLDRYQHLVGLVSLRELLLARPEQRVEEIMQSEVISVRVDQDQEEAARVLAKYDLLALPVVDPQNRLVGIITHDDVLDVMQQEATEDALHMAAVAPLEENYLEAPFVKVWERRAIWLSCLFIAELFTFTALAHFEHAIQAVTALALFVPLCISTGGNSGSQAATLVTRALAVGQVRLDQWWKVLRHELLMGLALGLTLGAIAFVRAVFTPESVLDGVDIWRLAQVVALSVAGICLWGTLVGAMLPLLFQRFGMDPGYASTPFVATFVDVTGIIIYFSIAQMLLLAPHGAAP